MEGTVRACAAITLATLLAACAVSREGWGKGRFLVVLESAPLQVRRSTIRVEDPTGDYVMNWIGARTPTNRPRLAEFATTLFEDRNGDNIPQSNEVRAHRSSAESAEKVLFSDIRVPAVEIERDWKLLVVARTSGGDSSSNVIAFRPDD